MTSAEQELAVRAVSQVVDAGRQSTWGVIVDRRGLTEDTDWDGVMLGRPVEITEWPDALGLRPDVAAQHPQLARSQGTPEPPLVVFGAGFAG
ncbi:MULTISPECIES: hypothetical protein [unclassified Streptomyces]|uniref:hypothetical protein n=1 Tax=unclassified Streptomyces TaxID=2593676 RepID=UPI0035E12847